MRRLCIGRRQFERIPGEAVVESRTTPDDEFFGAFMRETPLEQRAIRKTVRRSAKALVADLVIVYSPVTQMTLEEKASAEIDAMRIAFGRFTQF
jgi:hypothetical protein